jgi:hypothetical protein
MVAQGDGIGAMRAALAALPSLAASRPRPQRRRLATDGPEAGLARRPWALAQPIIMLVLLVSPRFTKVYPTSLGPAGDAV